jgi:hypothetical protein
MLLNGTKSIWYCSEHDLTCPIPLLGLLMHLSRYCHHSSSSTKISLPFTYISRGQEGWGWHLTTFSSRYEIYACKMESSFVVWCFYLWIILSKFQDWRIYFLSTLWHLRVSILFLISYSLTHSLSKCITGSNFVGFGKPRSWSPSKWSKKCIIKIKQITEPGRDKVNGGKSDTKATERCVPLCILLLQLYEVTCTFFLFLELRFWKF